MPSPTRQGRRKIQHSRLAGSSSGSEVSCLSEPASRGRSHYSPGFLSDHFKAANEYHLKTGQPKTQGAERFILSMNDNASEIYLGELTFVDRATRPTIS
jgi:hypothetical protein